MVRNNSFVDKNKNYIVLDENIMKYNSVSSIIH